MTEPTLCDVRFWCPGGELIELLACEFHQKPGKKQSRAIARVAFRESPDARLMRSAIMKPGLLWIVEPLSPDEIRFVNQARLVGVRPVRGETEATAHLWFIEMAWTIPADKPANPARRRR